MTTAQRGFLRRRLREAVAGQPELKDLVKVLLKLDGEFVVAPSWSDPLTMELSVQGFVFGGDVVMRAGRASECHDNVAALWRARRRGMVGIGTGYALSKDGLWRRHSWGLLRDGILETTAVRRKYFGVCWQGARADEFASS